jgi:hypothetical protein
MSEFALYFGLGKDHILDYVNGYDHILFVLALCAVYLIGDWRKILNSGNSIYHWPFYHAWRWQRLIIINVPTNINRILNSTNHFYYRGCQSF